MSGTFVQKRAFPDVRTWPFYMDNPKNINSTPFAGVERRGTSRAVLPLDSQETTSFRTRSSADVVSQSLDLDFFKGEKTDTGHPFSTLRKKVVFGPATYSKFLDRYGTSRLNGSCMPNPGKSTLVNKYFVPIPSWNSNQYGAKAISKTIPTTPEAGLAAFAGELREGLPSMIGLNLLKNKQGSQARNLGSEFLNMQFGWLPLIADVNKLCRAIIDSEKILKQYRRDSGRLVRRQHKFPIEKVNTTVQDLHFGQGENYFIGMCSDTSPEGVVGLTSSFSSGQSGQFTETTSTSQRIWFSGAYTYFLNEDDSFLGRLERYSQEANKLLGTRITPEVLWQLAPWSWLADWNANIGVNISNATAFQNDNLVLKYGYLMRETRTDHTYTVVIPESSDYGPRCVAALSYQQVLKERVKSTPYGFGLNSSQFTDKQWSILGALGMTRAPKSLP